VKIPVYFKSYKSETPNDGYWDYGLIKDLMSDQLWKPVNGYEFEFDYSNLPLSRVNRVVPMRGMDGGVVVIPARYHFDKIDEINEDIKSLKWVIVMLIGDEDGSFPTEKLVHDRMKVYLMLPHGKREKVDRYLPNGYPEGMREVMKEYGNEFLEKKNGWFFAGQVTHKRRIECIEGLRDVDTNNGLLIETESFTKGIKKEDFWREMVSSKVAVCPSGAVVPDSFRLYEALEGGCFPLVDNLPPNKKIDDFWRLIFGDRELPFTLVNSWKRIKDTINFHNDVYPHTANKVYAWWQNYKRELVYNLRDDIFTFVGSPERNGLIDNITVVIPSSFIKSHPSTEIIEETIRRVREHLPECEIIITFDGLREEYRVFRSQYDEYIRRMLWKCNFEYKNVLPVVLENHEHQIGEFRAVIGMVKTSMVLYNEHDTPICEEIPFEKMVGIIEKGEANVIRLHHEALILPVHRNLMLDSSPINVMGVPMVRTGQWSQRPHLASTDFYKKILFEFFKPDAYGMIEDGILGRVQESFYRRGQAGWNENKVMIYAPEGDMKRSYNLDGRESESKFEDTFKY